MLEPAVRPRRAVDERLHPERVPRVDPAQHRSVVRRDRRQDELESGGVSERGRRAEGMVEHHEDVVGGTAGLVPGAEVVGAHEPSRPIGADRLPVVAAKADRQVVQTRGAMHQYRVSASASAARPRSGGSLYISGTYPPVPSGAARSSPRRNRTSKEEPMNANLAAKSERKRWLVLAVTVVAQFMVILDVSVVNVALPSIKARPALLPGEPAVGDHRLLDPVRRHAAPGRPARRPARTPAAVHGRRRRLHARLAAVRARLVGGRADRHAGAAGARWRAARAGRALDRRHHVPRRARAQHRARRVGSGVRHRRRGRRAARRRPHLVPELVVDLLRQPARGRRPSSPSARGS